MNQFSLTQEEMMDILEVDTFEKMLASPNVASEFIDLYGFNLSQTLKEQWAIKLWLEILKRKDVAFIRDIIG